jgi:hypothetical protein
MIVIYNHQRFKIETLIDLDHGLAYDIVIRAIKGQSPDEIHNVKVTSTLNLVQNVTET